MQQEVKLRGLEGLKAVLLLLLIGVGLFHNNLLGGNLVPLALFTVFGYQWAYYIERDRQGSFWSRWRQVWRQWLPLLWLTSVTSIGLLIVNISGLSQLKYDFVSSGFLLENIRQIWVYPNDFLTLQASTGLATLWYLMLGIQLAAFITCVTWLLNKVGQNLLSKGIFWTIFILLLWFLAGVLALITNALSVVEVIFYAISFLTGVTLVYLVPVFLNLFYNWRMKQVAINGLGLVSTLVLILLLGSQSWSSLSMSFIWTAVIPSMTACLIFSYIAGAPVLRRTFEFGILVGLGYRLVYYGIAFAYTSFWLADSALWLHLLLSLVLGEVLYWFFVKDLPRLYFVNGRSWIQDYYQIYRAISLKEVATWELIVSALAASLIFVSVCLLGILMLIN